MTENISKIPKDWKASESNKQVFPLFPNSNNPSVFIKNRIKTSFPKFSSKFGEKSIFHNPCDCECEYVYNPVGSDQYRGINIKLLAEDLDITNQSVSPDQKNGGPLERNKFVAARYLTKETGYLPNPHAGKENYADLAWPSIKSNKEVEYADSDGNTKNTTTFAILNQVECCINTFPFLRGIVTTDSFNFHLSYLYRDKETELEDTGDTLMLPHDKLKYVAINLQFRNAEHLIKFLEKTNRDQLVEAYKKIIIDKYTDILQSVEESGEKLNRIYQHLPDFVAKAIGSTKAGEDKLFNHLFKLLSFDDQGIFSNFRDSSSAVVNLMRGFTNYKSLYQRFYENPALIKRIYNDLQGETSQNNLVISNRQAFCIFLSILSSACFDLQKITGKVFYIGQGYVLDSNLNSKYDINEGSIVLKQSKIPQPLHLNISSNAADKGDMKSYFPKPIKPIYSPLKKEKQITVVSKREEVTPEFGWFHPMDLVKLVFTDEGKIIIVPAILVKDLSDTIENEKIAADWNNLLRDIRLGLDWFVATFSFIVAVTNPEILLLRNVSFWVATGAAADAAIVTYEVEIKKMKYGPEFLEAWNTFQSLAGSLALAETARALISKGAKLLIALKNSMSKDFVIAVMMRALLEINIANFGANILKILNPKEVFMFSRYVVMTEYQATRLQEAGVVFMSATSKLTKEVQLQVFYQGEIIASGSATNVRERMKDVFKVPSGGKLTAALGRLWDMVPKLKGNQWTAINKAGTELIWDNQLGNVENMIQSHLENKIDPGKKWEAEVANEVSKYDGIINFSSDVNIIKNGAIVERAGDFDILSERYLIECKLNVNPNYLKKPNTIKQFAKYIDPENPKFINLHGKKVVLVVKNFNVDAKNYLALRYLERNNVIIIKGLNQIKNLK